MRALGGKQFDTHWGMGAIAAIAVFAMSGNHAWSQNLGRQLTTPDWVVPIQSDTVVANTEDDAVQSGNAQELKDALADIRSRLAEQRKQRSQSNRELVADEIRSAREEIAALTTSLSELRAQRDGLLNELTNTRADLRASREQLAAAERLEVQMREATEGLSQDFERQLTSLGQEAQRLRDEKLDLARQLEESIEQVATVRASVNDAWKERDDFEGALAEANAQLSAGAEEIASLKQANEESQSKITSLEQTQTSLEQEVTRKNISNQQVNAQLVEARDETAKMRSVANAMETELSEQIALSEARTAQLNAELDTMREVAGTSVLEVRELGEQLIEAISENQELALAIDELRTTKGLLSSELEAARRDVKIFAAEAASLRQQLLTGGDGSTVAASAGPVDGIAADANSDNASSTAIIEDAALETADEAEAPVTQLVALQNSDAAALVDAAKTEDATDGPPLQASLSEMNAVETADGWLMTIPDGIDFAPGSDELDEGSGEVLGKVAALITTYGSNAVRIVGHTDSNGDSGVNQRLSERRAQSVKQYLVDQFELGDDLIATEGFGESQPIASNNSPDGRRANRRVEVYLRR